MLIDGERNSEITSNSNIAVLDNIVSADLDYFENEIARFKSHFERGRGLTEMSRSDKQVLDHSQHVDVGTLEDLSESLSTNMQGIETDFKRLIEICQVLIKNFRDS